MEMAKKAGIALAYKAIKKKDAVGLIVFGSDVKESIPPTNDFLRLLKKIVSVRASKETEFTMLIRKAVELFPPGKVTKHLIILTDALPTVGKKPEEETIEAISLARAQGISISIVGINLNAKGKELAEKIVGLGQGRLYAVRTAENVDKIVLQDYYSIA